MDKTHITITAVYALFKVITCLYLSLSDKARSLSTLIAATVTKDSAHKIVPVIASIKCVLRQTSHVSLTTDIK